jgi:hypothetical protein
METSRRLSLLFTALAVVAAGCGGSDRESAERPAAARTATAPARIPHAVPWKQDDVVRRLAGRSITVEGRTIRVDVATLACTGVGRAAARVGGEPAWTRFRCVQPTFPPGAVAGPDALFFAEPTGPQSLAVRGSRLTTY